VEASLEDLENELAASIGAPLDTSLPEGAMTVIRRDLRRQHVEQFRGYKEAMEISVAIGDEETAGRQRAAAERSLKAVAEIDKRLKNGSAA